MYWRISCTSPARMGKNSCMPLASSTSRVRSAIPSMRIVPSTAASSAHEAMQEGVERAQLLARGDLDAEERHARVLGVEVEHRVVVARVEGRGVALVVLSGHRPLPCLA